MRGRLGLHPAQYDAVISAYSITSSALRLWKLLVQL
jgi:hypothetical protein